MIYIFTKFPENILDGIKAIHDFHKKISKGYNTVKMQMECRSLFSAYRLIMVYNCTKFHENIVNGWLVGCLGLKSPLR